MNLRYTALFIGGGLLLTTACENKSSNDDGKVDATTGGTSAATGGEPSGSGAEGGANATGGAVSTGGVGSGGIQNGSGGEDGESGGAGGEGSGGASGGAGGQVSAGSCPASLPDSQACTAGDGPCSYGDAPRVECRDRSACVGGVWVNTLSECGSPSAPSECPTEPGAGGDECEQVDQSCYYASGEDCLCVDSITSNIWVCNPPLVGVEGCPPIVPNEGTECEGSPSCNYACGPLSESSAVATCSDSGEWHVATAPCSIEGGG
jgi:hypothetical protein